VLSSETDEFPDPVDSNGQFDRTIKRRIGRRLTIGVPESGRLESCLGHTRRPCLMHCGLES